MWDSDVGGTAACGDLEPAQVAAFVRRQYIVDGGRVLLDVQPLQGGLEAVTVARVQAEAVADQGEGRRFTFVVKRLDGRGLRELAMYEFLATTRAPAIPEVLGVQAVSPTSSYLFLEWISASPWPWTKPALVAHVLERLAALHAALPVTGLAGPLSEWDYESELLFAAAATLDTLEAAVETGALLSLHRLIPVLRRVVAALPGMRSQLLSSGPLGRAVLHGDMHSGNVLVHGRSAQPSVVLIDWGRARLGSPLEDVSSWLESLGFWEPTLRQHRYALLQHYLRARGVPIGLGRRLYVSYWVAVACNALAGALRYHLLQALHTRESPSPRHIEAVRAVHDHVCAIEWADRLWRQAVLPQMVMLVKGPQVADPVCPVDHREAGVAGTEGFPASSAEAMERAQDLANDAGVGDDQDLLAGVCGGDGGDAAQDAPAELTVTLAAGPVESIIGLPQIGVPEEGIAPLYLNERDTFEPTAVNLAQ